MQARLAWFYKWSPQVIKDMPLDEAYDFFEAISVIEAQQTLLELRVSDWPYMKKDARSRWHRSLHKTAYPATHKNPVSTEKLMEMIQATVGS